MRSSIASVYITLNNIYLIIIKKVFNCKVINKRLELVSSEINNENLFLLFAWPGIILLGLSCISGHEKYRKQLDLINDLLENEKEPQAILNTLKEVINPDPIPAQLANKYNKLLINGTKEKCKNFFIKNFSHYMPELYGTISLLLNYQPEDLISKNLREDLFYFLGNYYVMVCMIVKLSNKMKNPGFLKLNEINKISSDYVPFIKNLKVDLFFWGYHFWAIMDRNIIKIRKEAIKKLKNEQHQLGEHQNPIHIPHSDHYLHNVFIGDTSYCLIKKTPNIDIQIKRENSIGTATNINIFNNSDYQLWQINVVSSCLSGNEAIDNAYLFFNIQNNEQGIMPFSKHFLYIAQNSMNAALRIALLWGDNINNPKSVIEEKLNIHTNWLSEMTEIPWMLEALFNFTNFYNSSLSLDPKYDSQEIKDSGFDKLRRKLVTKSRKRISPEDKEIFNEAYNEIKKILEHVKNNKKKNVEEFVVVDGEISKKNIKKDRNKDEIKKIAEDYLEMNETSFIHVIKEDLEWLKSDDPEHGNRISIEKILNKVGVRNGKDFSGPIIWKALGKKR